MEALFFDCDAGTRAFLSSHHVRDVIYHLVDFELDMQNVLQFHSPEKIEIISMFAHAQSIDTKALDYFENLKMIATRSTGFNHIDLDYCKKRGILVCNVPNYGATSVAEFTLGMMIGLMRKITLAKSQMKTNNVFLPNYLGESLKNKTVGIIGTGSIGRAVIKLVEAFGSNVIAYDPYPNEQMKKAGLKYVDLNQLYKQADVISLHCPATKENFHLLDEKAFAQMKKGVYIINTARGSLIDTEALYEALRSEKIAGAALDVLENEDVLTEREISTDMEKKTADFLLDSVINFKLIQLNNTLITPHIAFNSVDAVEQILSTTVENIAGFKNGKIQNRVV